MNATYFQTLAVTVSLLAGLVSSLNDVRCPRTVYSFGLQNTLDVFAISNRCFVMVLNDNAPSTTPNERCSAAVPGSVVTDQQIDAQGNFVNKVNYIVCEIQPVKTENSDDNLGVVPVDTKHKTTIHTDEMDAYMKACIKPFKYHKSAAECKNIRLGLTNKLGGKEQAKRLLKRRRDTLLAQMNSGNDTMIGIFAIVGSIVAIILILIVFFGIFLSKNKSGKKRRRKEGAATPAGDDTTNTDGTTNADGTATVEEAKRKKKKKRKLLKKLRNDADEDDTKSKTRTMSLYSKKSTLSTVSKKSRRSSYSSSKKRRKRH